VIWQWYNNDVTDDYDLAHLRGEVGDLGAPPLPDTPPEPQGLGRYSAVYMTISTVLKPATQKIAVSALPERADQRARLSRCTRMNILMAQS